jgi:hypothetical protein
VAARHEAVVQRHVVGLVFADGERVALQLEQLVAAAGVAHPKLRRDAGRVGRLLVSHQLGGHAKFGGLRFVASGGAKHGSPLPQHQISPVGHFTFVELGARDRGALA